MGKIVRQTQLYVDCYDLLGRIIDLTALFPREYKHTIGQRMTGKALDMVERYIAAYTAQNLQTRADNLDAFVADFEVLKMLIRIAGERRWIAGRTRHAMLIELIEKIGKQSSGFRNSLSKH